MKRFAPYYFRFLLRSVFFVSLVRRSVLSFLLFAF